MFSTIAAFALAATLVQPPSLTPIIAITELENPSNPSNSSPPLLPLYISFATLQVLDVHSTTSAISSGAGRESNPALRGIASNRPALIAVKVASTGVAIWATEKLRKKHRAAAVGLMVALNSFMGVVVAHNYSVR